MSLNYYIFTSKINNPHVPDELLTLETLPGPLLVDNMENEASRAFGSFPDRLYILLEGKIVYMVSIEDRV